MNKSLVMKIAGVVAIVAGSILLYISGVDEEAITAIVAGVFVLAGVIIFIFKPKE